MIKLITTVNWHQQEAASSLLPRLCRLLPDGCRISQALESPATEFDLLLEHYSDSPRVLDELYRQFADQAILTSYLVEEYVEKDEPGLSAGTGALGRKLISGWFPRSDVSMEQARRHWNEHVPLANRIHIGCRRYVRNWVRSLARASGDFPPLYAGFAFQYYATEEDLAERMFDKPESATLIQRDVEEFIAAYAVQICSERVHDALLSAGEASA